LLLGANRSANAFAINVYYVNHYREGSPAHSTNINGETYTNDAFPSIPNTRTGFIVSVYAAPLAGGTLLTGAIDSTDAHELGHFLLDNYHDMVGPGEHHGDGLCGAAGGPNRFYLMYGTGCTMRRFLDPAECTNIKTNTDESVYVEQF
jgi:hypothetical protein